MIKHKKALYEIFIAEMEAGGSLFGKCDAVLKSSSLTLPDSIYNFITLGDFTIVDVATGDLRDKFMVVTQSIICGSVVVDEADAEEEAEFRAYTLARLIRTILKGNQKLISSSYPEGVAKSSGVSDSSFEPVIYSESPCHLVVLSFWMKMEED